MLARALLALASLAVATAAHAQTTRSAMPVVGRMPRRGTFWLVRLSCCISVISVSVDPVKRISVWSFSPCRSR
jgi:hypothetical protein